MPSDCPRPELLVAPENRESFVQVDYWEKENAIMVHGTVTGAVTAVLRGVPVEDLVGVTASIHSMHRESPALGYRLALAPAGADREAAADVDALLWTVLLPRQWGETHAFLNEPYSGPLDLLLTVMVANHPGASNWAWGLFRGFRLRSVPVGGERG